MTIRKTSKTRETPQVGDLRVWWIPQVPGRRFVVVLGKQTPQTLAQAKLLLGTLASYDRFQFNNRIKPDYCNAGGLEVWETEDDQSLEGDWVTWYDQEGHEIENVDPATAVWEGTRG